MTHLLRVLHIDTERGWRGGERQALWLAEGLTRRGYANFVVARPGQPLAARAHDAGLMVVPSDPFGELDPAAAIRLRRTILAERVDIVHAHASHALALGALATVGTGARLVATRRVDFRLHRNPASRWKYGRADAIIAVSRAVADALEASGIAPGRVEIIHSGIDLTREILPATVDELAALGVERAAPLVVMVGALVDHKDPLTFVSAIAEARRSVPDVQALLVGDGPLRGPVERTVAALSLHDALHLTGYRSDADAFVAAADVVVLSSREEGLGSVTIDAMALGKPVATTAAGGIPEIVAHERTGLVVPVGDAAALGEAIARLLRDRALNNRLSTAARARAQLFSIDHTVERTVAVYERVMADGVAAR